MLVSTRHLLNKFTTQFSASKHFTFVYGGIMHIQNRNDTNKMNQFMDVFLFLFKFESVLSDSIYFRVEVENVWGQHAFRMENRMSDDKSLIKTTRNGIWTIAGGKTKPIYVHGLVYTFADVTRKIVNNTFLISLVRLNTFRFFTSENCLGSRVNCIIRDWFFAIEIIYELNWLFFRTENCASAMWRLTEQR